MPDVSWNAMQREMIRQLGVVGSIETRTADAHLLTVRQPDAPGLKPTADPTRPTDNSVWAKDRFACTNREISDLAAFLEDDLNVPVVDETGLTNHFDIDLAWDKESGSALREALLQ